MVRTKASMRALQQGKKRAVEEGGDEGGPPPKKGCPDEDVDTDFEDDEDDTLEQSLNECYSRAAFQVKSIDPAYDFDAKRSLLDLDGPIRARLTELETVIKFIIDEFTAEFESQGKQIPQIHKG